MSFIELAGIVTFSFAIVTAVVSTYFEARKAVADRRVHS